MKILLDKSKNSLEASSLLKNEDLYASSVHCSYYSCIQLMRHVLFNHHSIDEMEFDKGEQIQSVGSHFHLLNTITSNMAGDDIRTLKNTFRNIKTLRKQADYNQIIIFKEDSNNAYNFALKINRILKTKYLL